MNIFYQPNFNVCTAPSVIFPTPFHNRIKPLSERGTEKAETKAEQQSFGGTDNDREPDDNGFNNFPPALNQCTIQQSLGCGACTHQTPFKGKWNQTKARWCV